MYTRPGPSHAGLAPRSAGGQRPVPEARSEVLLLYIITITMIILIIILIIISSSSSRRSRRRSSSSSSSGMNPCRTHFVILMMELSEICAHRDVGPSIDG